MATDFNNIELEDTRMLTVTNSIRNFLENTIPENYAIINSDSGKNKLYLDNIEVDGVMSKVNFAIAYCPYYNLYFQQFEFNFSYSVWSLHGQALDGLFNVVFENNVPLLRIDYAGMSFLIQNLLCGTPITMEYDWLHRMHELILTEYDEVYRYWKDLGLRIPEEDHVPFLKFCEVVSKVLSAYNTSKKRYKKRIKCVMSSKVLHTLMPDVFTEQETVCYYSPEAICDFLKKKYPNLKTCINGTQL